MVANDIFILFFALIALGTLTIKEIHHIHSQEQRNRDEQITNRRNDHSSFRAVGRLVNSKNL
jgi:hypothetical protein